MENEGQRERGRTQSQDEQALYPRHSEAGSRRRGTLQQRLRRLSQKKEENKEDGLQGKAFQEGRYDQLLESCSKSKMKTKSIQ